MYKYKYQSKISFCYHLEDRNFGLGGLQLQSKYRCKCSANTDANTAQIQVKIQLRKRKSPGRRRFEIGEIQVRGQTHPSSPVVAAAAAEKHQL